MPDTTLCSLEALAAAIPDGALLAVPKDSSGVAMAATRELVRRGVRDLHLLCVPLSGIQADILIGAGCVRTLETSAVTLGEYGAAPRFVAALKERSLADDRFPHPPLGIRLVLDDAALDDHRAFGQQLVQPAAFVERRADEDEHRLRFRRLEVRLRADRARAPPPRSRVAARGGPPPAAPG